MNKSTYILIISAVGTLATCPPDLIPGCQANWCAVDWWASQCQTTCGDCSEPEPCKDIQAGCQANWCGDAHWRSQCLATCRACSEVVTPVTSPPTNAPIQTTGSPTNTPIQATAAPTIQATGAPTNTPIKATGAPTFQAVQPVQPTNGKHFVMYYPAWATYGRNFQVADIDASHLTHINYGFVNINGGECALGDPYADTQKFFSNTDSWNDPGQPLRGNFKQLQHLKEQHPHVQTLISIGGWTWSTQFSSLASTEQGRVKFAQSCAGFMRRYGFDGIDVDWEFPVTGGDSIPQMPEDRENFTLLLRALRAAMDGLNDGYHPLTIATSANPNTIQVSYDVPAINKAVDFVNVMSYDFNGAWTDTTGHNAPLFSNSRSANLNFNVDAAVQAYLDAGLTKDKLVLGLAFYGRGWSNVQAGSSNNGLFQGAKGAAPGTWEDGVLDYSDLVENYVNKNGFTRYWDSDSKVPYLYNPESKVFISYDDEESICHKAGYAARNDLAGAMVWEVTSDFKRSLQKLAYDVIVGGADGCHFD